MKGIILYMYLPLAFFHLNCVRAKSMYIYVSFICSVVSDSVTPWTVACRLLHPWDSLGKNTGVGCHFLLQGVFPTQGSNLGLLHCKQILHHLSH